MPRYPSQAVIDKAKEMVKDTCVDLNPPTIAAALLDVLELLRIEREEASKCWTCGGDPNSHPSGVKCVCGDGTHESEVLHLRQLAARAEEGSDSRIAELEDELSSILLELDDTMQRAQDAELEREEWMERALEAEAALASTDG